MARPLPPPPWVAFAVEGCEPSLLAWDRLWAPQVGADLGENSPLSACPSAGLWMDRGRAVAGGAESALDPVLGRRRDTEARVGVQGCGANLCLPSPRAMEPQACANRSGPTDLRLASSARQQGRKDRKGRASSGWLLSLAQAMPDLHSLQWPLSSHCVQQAWDTSFRQAACPLPPRSLPRAAAPTLSLQPLLPPQQGVGSGHVLWTVGRCVLPGQWDAG